MVIPPEDFKLFKTASLYPPLPSPLSTSTPCLNQAITLNNNSTWTHCGPLLDLTSVPPSFDAWARASINGDLVPHLLPFLSFVHTFMAEVHMDHYWITIRATRPTHDFDQPRWHTDWRFFDRKEGEAHWKLATALVGPGTLLLADGTKGRALQQKARLAARKTKAAAHDCRAVRCLGCADLQDVVRARLAKELEGAQVVQPVAGECVFFRVGDEDGAMHSEPANHCDRVFVNVVPGTELELRQLAERWGMSFPRAWSIGVPLNYGN